jgi:hypothetical protein
MAVMLLPVVLLKRAKAPFAVLLAPLLLLKSEFRPLPRPRGRTRWPRSDRDFRPRRGANGGTQSRDCRLTKTALDAVRGRAT